MEEIEITDIVDCAASSRMFLRKDDFGNYKIQCVTDDNFSFDLIKFLDWIDDNLNITTKEILKRKK